MGVPVNSAKADPAYQYYLEKGTRDTETTLAWANLFLTLTTNIGTSIWNSRGSDNDDDGKGKVGNDAEIKELKNQLTPLLDAIGAKDENDINEAVNRAQAERDQTVAKNKSDIEAELNRTTGSIDETYKSEVSNLRDKAQSDINGINTNATLSDQEKAAKIKDIEDKLEKDLQYLERETNKKIDEANQKAQAELEAKVKVADTALQEISKKANEAIGILNQIYSLNGQTDTTTVPEATENLNTFNKQRDIMNSNTETKENRQAVAKTIKELAENNPDDKTLQNAYTAIKDQVEYILSDNYDENKDEYGYLRGAKGTFGI